eukprot:6127297-Ditylum_brightwellii.AAC.1
MSSSSSSSSSLSSSSSSHSLKSSSSSSTPSIKLGAESVDSPLLQLQAVLQQANQEKEGALSENTSQKEERNRDE